MSTTRRSAAFVFSFLSLALLLASCQENPVSEIQAAEDALARAAQAGAKEYAAETLRSAEGTLQKAREELSSQDKTFAVLRDYEAAKKLLTQTKLQAEDAARQAEAAKVQAKSEAVAAVGQARAKLDNTRILLARAPTGKGTRADIQALQSDLAAAEHMVTEGQSALDQQDFRGAAAKAQSAQTLADQVGGQVTRALEKATPKKR